LAAEELRLLEAAGTGNGVAVILLTEREAIEEVLEYVVRRRAGWGGCYFAPSFV